MPHVISKLHNDHEEVRELLRRMKDTTDGAEKTRRQLCQQLKQEVEAHTEFEETMFYPAIREKEGTENQVSQALDEHKEVHQMLDQIGRLDPYSSEFTDMVSRLEAAIDEHVRREEEEIFPLAELAIDDKEDERMAQHHDSIAQDHARST